MRACSVLLLLLLLLLGLLRRLRLPFVRARAGRPPGSSRLGRLRRSSSLGCLPPALLLPLRLALRRRHPLPFGRINICALHPARHASARLCLRLCLARSCPASRGCLLGCPAALALAAPLL
jgi:hypothetical protein